MDSTVILILLLLASQGNNSGNVDSLHRLKEYAKDFKVDYSYSKEKIKILKNVLPYLPENQLHIAGKSVVATEKVLRILETVDYVNLESNIPIEPLEMDTMERAYKIVGTLQEDISNSKIDKFGTALDLIVNKDKYKSLLDLTMELLSDKESLNNPANLAKLVNTFLGEDAEDSNLTSILEILTMLDSPKEKEEQPSDDS